MIAIIIWSVIVLLFVWIVYDRYFQKKNLVIGNFPVLGRMRYFFHELRPFFRQYFGDDDSFAPRIIIDWILNVSAGRTGYFAFDKFDTTAQLHNGKNQMLHSATPMNIDEMDPVYPTIGSERKNPFTFKSYFYRSAMSLGSLSFEATSAMAAACADAKTPFNTGEGALSVHHIPRVSFSKDKKFFKYTNLPAWAKALYALHFGEGMRTNIVDFIGNKLFGKNHRDLYLFCKKNRVFYTIDWDAPLKYFPKPNELTDEFGHIILQSVRASKKKSRWRSRT